MMEKNGHTLNNRHMSGFTLFEILVSISIFAVLATMVYSSLNATLSKNEIIKGSNTGFEMAKNTMNRISMDLTTAFVTQYPEYQVPGIYDEPDAYRFHGEDSFHGITDSSWVSFASTEHLGISSDIISGLARITYYPERPDNRDDQLFVLKRSDVHFPYDIDPDEQPYRSQGSGNDPVLCENVAAFSITYVDENGETQKTWDSDSERHQFSSPRAVIVKLSIAAENGTHDFSTRVDIPVYRKGVENVRR